MAKSKNKSKPKALKGRDLDLLKGYVLGRALQYGKARLEYVKILDEVDTVKGLDEFHPKSVAWENRLYKESAAKNTAKGELLGAAFALAGGVEE